MRINLNTIQQINQSIAMLDKKLELQLNQILHHPTLQQIEASWRGLNFMLSTITQPRSIKIKLLHANLTELCDDLVQAHEIDQSALFNKLYTNEYDHPGGEPFGLLIGDYYLLNNIHLDCHLLTLLSRLCALAFTPFITSIHAHFLGINNHNDLQPHMDLSALFAADSYLPWHQLHKQESARFLGLTLSRFLLREPYQNNLSINFKEIIDQHADYLWGNMVFTFAASVIRSFANSHWFYQITGLNPHHAPQPIHIRELSCTHKPALQNEVHLTSQQAQLLANNGLIAMYEHPLVNESGYILTPSVHYHNTNTHNLNGLLQYVLCASRFAHYIKVIARDKIGLFSNAEQCEHYLQSWLLKHCAAHSRQATPSYFKYPLREAQVSIQSDARTPNKFYCHMTLVPQQQINKIHVQLKLITDLPSING